MKIEGDDLVFSTGRRFYANCGIIGLAPSLNVYYGYDGTLDAWPSEWQESLTEAERVELADHMIKKWTEFKAASGPSDV